MNNIIIVSGPSGSGKDSVIQGLLKKYKQLKEVATYTTRKIRPNETKGVGHFFVKIKKFNELYKTGEIVEKNFYAGAWYGTSKSAILEIQKTNQIPIIEIDVNGFSQIKKLYPEALGIYIGCSDSQAKQRLRNRGDISPDQIKKRLEIKKIEDQCQKKFDLVVENQTGKLSQTIDTTLNFIKKRI